jgi:hypothetical protein
VLRTAIHIGAALTALAISTAASAREVYYYHPMAQGIRLDWCYSWGADCGQQAADAWCRVMGFRRALNLAIQTGVHPTRVISTGAVCDEAYCNGFAYITCSTHLASPLVHLHP